MPDILLNYAINENVTQLAIDAHTHTQTDCTRNRYKKCMLICVSFVLNFTAETRRNR